MTTHKSYDHPEPQRDGRKYAVFHNRGNKRQRVRYVETGGAAVDPEQCVFCDVTPFLEDASTDEAHTPGPECSQEPR